MIHAAHPPCLADENSVFRRCGTTFFAPRPGCGLWDRGTGPTDAEGATHLRTGASAAGAPPASRAPRAGERFSSLQGPGEPLAQTPVPGPCGPLCGPVGGAPPTPTTRVVHGFGCAQLRLSYHFFFLILTSRSVLTCVDKAGSVCSEITASCGCHNRLHRGHRLDNLLQIGGHVVQRFANPGGVIAYPGKFHHRHDFRLWNTFPRWAMTSVATIQMFANQFADSFAALAFLNPLPPIEDVLVGVIEGFEGNELVLALLFLAFSHRWFLLEGVLPIKPVGQTGKTPLLAHFAMNRA